MLDDTDTPKNGTTTGRTRRRAVSRPSGPPAEPPAAAAEATPDASGHDTDVSTSTAKKAPAKKTAAKRSTAKKSVAKTSVAATPDEPAAEVKTESAAEPATDTETPARKKPARRPAKQAPAVFSGMDDDPESTVGTTPRRRAKKATAAADGPDELAAASPEAPATFVAPLFQAPDSSKAAARKPARKAAQPSLAPAADDDADRPPTDVEHSDDADDTDEDGAPRRRRRRGGRRRRKSGADGESLDETSDDVAVPADRADGAAAASAADSGEEDGGQDDAEDPEDAEGGGSTTRRRRRRRRRGEGDDLSSDDAPNTVVRIREPRNAADEITSVSGSTRLEAKKQRRREGREAGRRRAPIVSESEFLARRESVKREMVIRQRSDLTQIAVVEDDVLVEHYVARESQTSLIGNVYLGRVQNVLPSMEAAFVDIGKGRNAVLYAGEVDWNALGNGKQRKIEEVLKSGQTVLVQVTKDPIGHKGARLTSQVSLAGRFLVYVPAGQTSGISRKLPDGERNRLKSLLKDVLPEDASVIIRTAAEGATEEQLTRDVSALTARWDDIERKANDGKAPQLLYGEPDLMIKVVRDLFNEDFARLVVEGDDAWDMIEGYVGHVAPDLADRLQWWGASEPKNTFEAYRIDEQIAKGMDRKVWLPSGGSLVIDRTEAMTVVDVNTGKFTGSGGNLEETVTKNNLEAAEEIVRQLRLRDIGGIIVIDFIDMVLENNRDLVLRRLVECLGRDRTRHQVAEVTSLGLVQMTRKRIGTGLLEAFSEPCAHCHGRGLTVHDQPVEPHSHDDSAGRGTRRRGGRGGDNLAGGGGNSRGRGERTPEPAPQPAPEPVSEASPSAPEPASASTEPAPTTPPRPAMQPATTPTATTPQATSPQPPRRRSARRPAGAATVADAPQAPDSVLGDSREDARGG